MKRAERILKGRAEALRCRSPQWHGWMHTGSVEVVGGSRVLHTGSNLLTYYHIHAVVPAGGLSADHQLPWLLPSCGYMN